MNPRPVERATQNAQSTPNSRAANPFTIPPQAAQWLEAGVESIESGRLRPAADRARMVHAWLDRTRRRLFTAAIVGASAFLLWHVIFGANGAMVYQQKRAKVKALQGDIVALQKENDAYARRVELLKRDPQTIEGEARKQFHLVRPGEVVYVQPAPPAPPPPANFSARKD